jgi:hypothetical protein
VSAGVNRVAVLWRTACAVVAVVFALIVISVTIVNAAPATPSEPAAATTQPTTRSSRRRFIVAPASAPSMGSLIPGILAQQQAEAKIKEIYATDYADTSFNGRRALAQRLMFASDETKHDTDAKFVLLREAREVATAAGDVSTAFEAVDRMVCAFPLVKLSERVEVMKKAVPVLSSPQANLAATSICMDLVDQCVVEGDYDHADELLCLATDTVRAAKSRPHAVWIEARAASLRPLKAAWDIAKPSQERLAHAPGDAEANLVMGKFLTFVKGDFDAGLNMLAKGSDPQLAKIADEDLDTPADRASLQLKLAGDWWDLCESQPAEYRSAIRRRAAYWYKLAAPSLDGLDKALARRRLQELNPQPKPGDTKVFTRPPDALRLTNHWYRASVAEVSWETAQRLCQESGGQLACIETRAEGELMTKLARGRALWLGASIDAGPNGSGKWMWLSGADFFFNNWSWGEPSNLTAESHPVTGPTGAWKTLTGKAGFICEWNE